MFITCYYINVCILKRLYLCDKKFYYKRLITYYIDNKLIIIIQS